MNKVTMRRKENQIKAKDIAKMMNMNRFVYLYKEMTYKFEINEFRHLCDLLDLVYDFT